jgi:hypothetical protein
MVKHLLGFKFASFVAVFTLAKFFVKTAGVTMLDVLTLATLGEPTPMSTKI